MKLERSVGTVPAPKEKEKFTLWLYPETLKKVTEIYRQNDCVSRSEFIEKALWFYIGYLTAEDKSSYLPNMFLSNMNSIVLESDSRQSKIIFKLAVEMAIMMNLMAWHLDIDKTSLERLRGECIKEVKRLNGSFSFDDAVEWQKG